MKMKVVMTMKQREEEKKSTDCFAQLTCLPRDAQVSRRRDWSVGHGGSPLRFLHDGALLCT